MRFATLACALLLICLTVVPGHAERHVALVIGNDRYANLPADQQLQKAVNDSRAVGDALGQLGFEVIRGENLGRQALVDKFDEMTRKLLPGDVAFFFFAGHGVTIGGGNYILPADVPYVEPGQETRLQRAALGESDLVSDLQQHGARVALVVLDACRDNPFRRPGVRSVGGERGLSRVESARGVFTFYSAGLGQTALDRLGNGDSNPNSVFTRVLVPRLANPTLDLTALAIDVREEVAQLAGSIGHEQRPAYYDETIGGRIYLAGLSQPQQLNSGTSPSSTEAAQAWAIVKDMTDIRAVEAFRRQYGAANTFYDRLAEGRIEELKRAQLAVTTPPAAPSSPPLAPRAEPAAAITPTRPATGCVEAQVGNEKRCLSPKDSFKDCPNCPEMVVIPAGEFMMGSTESEDEKPPHKVTITRPFAVGKFAVTFAEWDACVADAGCKHRPADEGWGREKRPVINLSWDDATKEYLPWLSRKTGKSYRLLSEAEWEYVARAGSTTKYFWGDEIGQNRANCFNCGSQWDGKQTAPVGSFEANAFGVYDMHGNVSQFVQDNWRPNYQGAPTDGSVWSGGDGSLRVARGGSWGTIWRHFYSAFRVHYHPVDRNRFLGFRVARTL
jgi:formylglycine-generating enzyme required for sulfatase activity